MYFGWLFKFVLSRWNLIGLVVTIFSTGILAFKYHNLKTSYESLNKQYSLLQQNYKICKDNLDIITQDYNKLKDVYAKKLQTCYNTVKKTQDSCLNKLYNRTINDLKIDKELLNNQRNYKPTGDKILDQLNTMFDNF